MRRSGRFGLVLGSIAALAGAVLVAAPAPGGAATGCDTVPIFETDGYHASPTAATFQDFNSRVPAGYEARPVYYDGGVFPLVDKRALDDAVADGAGKLIAAVREYHSRCAGGRMILAGYSEGAAVADAVIEQLARGDEIPHRLVTAVLYGNPRRPVGDGGLGGRAGGIETSIPSFFPGVTMQGPADYGDIAVHDICHVNDGICNSANFFRNTPAFVNGLVGYGAGDHAYDKDPVRDQGHGLTLVQGPARVPYGPPLPLDLPNPYQLQQRLGLYPALLEQFLAKLRALLPAGTSRDLPWLALLTRR